MLCCYIDRESELALSFYRGKGLEITIGQYVRAMELYVGGSEYNQHGPASVSSRSRLQSHHSYFIPS